MLDTQKTASLLSGLSHKIRIDLLLDLSTGSKNWTYFSGKYQSKARYGLDFLVMKKLVQKMYADNGQPNGYELTKKGKRVMRSFSMFTSELKELWQ